jgi:hypothetical protein
MRRFRIAMPLCVAAALGLIIADDTHTISNDAQTNLAIEWKDLKFYPTDGSFTAATHCLKALDLYTQEFTSDDPLIPLKELMSGANPSPPPARTATWKFYPLAHRLGRMPDLLATATTLKTTNSKDVDKLFDEVESSILVLYQSHPEDLYRSVDREYASHPARAFYNLLDANARPLKDYTPAQPGARTAAESNAKLLEKYRTCYGLDRDRLFHLIHNLFT